MGFVKSIYEPLVHSKERVHQTQDQLIQDLMDKIIMTYATLIADIEEKKIESSFLKKEISKHVDKQKGLYRSEDVKRIIFETIYGYGRLEPYVKSSCYSDIDAPRFDYVLGRKKGKIERLPISFSSEEEFEKFCRLLIIRHGGILNAVDTHCRVSDQKNHLRINVSIPPRNATGTSLSIRKHAPKAYSYDELSALRFLDERSKVIIESLNFEQKSILICGKGGSGKTTLLRTLIDSGQLCERVLICESDNEIYPQKKNTIVQHIQKQRSGLSSVTLDCLIKEGLTMSLDSYCIGEITGKEAWPFIKAGHTDHRIMGTIHSSSARDAVQRLLMLIENETQLPAKTLKEMIGQSVQIIVYVKDFSVSEIIKINRFNPQNETFEFDYLYQKNEGGK